MIKHSNLLQLTVKNSSIILKMFLCWESDLVSVLNGMQQITGAGEDIRTYFEIKVLISPEC